MKQIVFKSISIKNFLSVGEEPVVINFRPGLNIITGINKDKEDRRNGVGKSTIADAIYFAVFGTSLRELKKEHIVNNITRKNCEVIFDFCIIDSSSKDDYQIVRMLEPSKCIIYKNGIDKTLDSIINTNEYIANKVSCSPEIMQNCVIMTANNTIPFMAKKKVEKRKFIEGIFNLEVFGNMLLGLRQEYNDLKKNHDVDAALFSEVESNYKTQIKQKESQEEEKKRKLDKYLTRQKNNTTELEKLNNDIKLFKDIDIDKIKIDIKKLEEKEKKTDDKIGEFRNQNSSIKTTILHLKEDFSVIGTDKSTCPTCLRQIDNNDRDHIKNEKNRIKEEIKKHADKIEENSKSEKEQIELKQKINSAIDKLEDSINEFNLKSKDKENILTRIEQLKVWQKELEIDIKDLNNPNTSLDRSINELKSKLNELTDKIEVTKNNLNILDTVKFVVSEEGVKSYIVKKILQLFNSRLAYYLKKMDANCVCTFNEYFEEEIYDEKGKLCSYFNFSGAERKNIDIACLFAFMDIRRLQGNVSFNFSVYDELLDTSLDEKGVELVLGILRERVEKYNECIMVISHRKESTKFATGDIIFLEKKNGKTRKIDYVE